MSESCSYKQNHASKHFDALVVFAICGVVLLFLFGSGALPATYHLTDDHEIVKIAIELEKDTLIAVTKRWVIEDFKIRFRPFYYIHRIVCTKVLGTNFFAWSLYNTLLCCLTISLLYVGIRRMAFSVTSSIFFVIFVFTGPQMAIWWRLGPAETIGVFFLALAFFLASFTKTTALVNAFFSLVLICSSLTKETFTIVVPAFIFLKLFSDYNKDKSSIRFLLWKNKLLIIPFCIACLNLWVILRFIGTSYAGLNSSPLFLIKGVLGILFFIPRHSALLFSTLAISHFILFLFKRPFFSKYLTESFYSFFFSFLIIVPNILIYARSGMNERYLIPATLGIAFLYANLFQKLQGANVVRTKLLVICVVFLMAYPAIKMKENANRFSAECAQVDQMLQGINNSSNPKSKVLLVADPVAYYEWSFSLQTILKIRNNISLYGFPIAINLNNAYSETLFKTWNSWFAEHQLSNLQSNPDLIVFFTSSSIDLFFKESQLNINEYKSLLHPNVVFCLYKKVHK